MLDEHTGIVDMFFSKWTSHCISYLAIRIQFDFCSEKSVLANRINVRYLQFIMSVYCSARALFKLIKIRYYQKFQTIVFKMLVLLNIFRKMP